MIMESEHQQNSSILKELSDIKASLAVNTSETKNIKDTISEIKTDLKEIKNDFVNRRELTDVIKSLKEETLLNLGKTNDEVSLLRKIIYGAISFILLAVLSAVVYGVIKR